jgi:hypothetical protein
MIESLEPYPVIKSLVVSTADRLRPVVHIQGDDVEALIRIVLRDIAADEIYLRIVEVAEGVSFRIGVVPMYDVRRFFDDG